MKQSSMFALVVGSMGLLVLALAGIMFRAQAQAEGTEFTADPASASAATPLFSYQGELRNAAGNPITNSSLPMTFRLFGAPTGGSACWTESRSVNVQNGQFSVVLGQGTAIPLSCVTRDAYLEVTINSETLSPREVLTSVASAIVANTLTAGAEVLGPLTVTATLTGNDVKANASLWSAYDVVLGAPGTAFIIHSRRNNNNDFLQITSEGAGGWKWEQGISLVAATGNVGIGTHGPEQRLDVAGNTLIRGNLDLRGTCARTSLNQVDAEDGPENIQCQPGSIISGAYVEANLMSPDERNADEVTRFNHGDLLCWSPEEQQLHLCDTKDNRLVMAVANSSGKPIVLGAEPVKAIGPLRAGDLLVSSNIPGYAMVNNDPLPGTVIGQALEDLDRDAGLIKAMIRKW